MDKSSANGGSRSALLFNGNGEKQNGQGTKVAPGGDCLVMCTAITMRSSLNEAVNTMPNRLLRIQKTLTIGVKITNCYYFRKQTG